MNYLTTITAGSMNEELKALKVHIDTMESIEVMLKDKIKHCVDVGKFVQVSELSSMILANRRVIRDIESVISKREAGTMKSTVVRIDANTGQTRAIDLLQRVDGKNKGVKRG